MTAEAPVQELRGYQAEAVEAIASGLADGGRRQLIMACGTGKTFVASRTAARLAGGGVTAVLVPSIPLAAQTIAAWQAGCPTDQVLAVCSDPTVRPTWVRAADLPAQVTTDAEEIAKWLVGVSGRALAVAVFDSAHRLAAGLRLAGQVVELTVCDEAHRLAGAPDKFTAAITEQGFLPERRRLSMTATAKFIAQVRGKPKAISMDDEEVFGPVAYRYPFRRAIDEGWLKDYRIVVAAVTHRQVAELLAAEDDLAEDDVPVRLAAAQAALAMAATQFGLRRCVAFLPRIAQARQFAGRLPATLAMLPEHRRPAGPLSSGYVHGGMSSLQRDLVLEHLRRPPDGGWAVVANARCLGEGVDVPEIDSVLFGSPKESVTDIVQAVGRALRRHDDTDTATVIVPALVPDDGEDGEPDGGRYEHVLNVIRAMCAHDADLAEALGAARAARAADPDGPASLPSRVAVIGPPGILQATLDALRIHVLDRTTSSWWDGYGHARAYHQEHGNLDVPHAYVTADGYPLGTWLSAQRAERNSGTLAAERIRLLNALGMTWDLLEDAWMSAYRELRAFRDAHGHLEVPLDYVTADGIGLAEWQGTQRDTDRAGKMAPARRRLLEAIGFTLDPKKARWTRRYEQLAAAVTRHGGPGKLPPGSPEATWLEGQMLAHHRGKLDDAKIALLEKLGITVRRPDPWDAAYRDLKAFKDEHGHLRVPDGHKGASGIDLSDWKADQRVRRKAGRMAKDHERLLDEIGFDWDPGEDAWQARYAEAAAWKREHGSLRFPRSHPVGGWLYRQQKLHDGGRLQVGRARLLRDLGALPGTGQQDTASTEPQAGTGSDDDASLQQPAQRDRLDGPVPLRGLDVRVPARHRQAGGELLVLLHGLGCSKDSFNTAFDDESLLEYSLLALDLPGHGASEHGQPGALHTLEAFAGITRLAVSQLTEPGAPHYDQVHFGGHSMGGAVAVIAARDWRGNGCTVSIDGNLTGEDCGLASRTIASQSPAGYTAGGHRRLVAGLLGSGRPDMAAWAAWLARADPAAVHAAARSLVAWSDNGKLLTWFNALERKALLYGDREDKRHLTGRLDPAVTCQLSRSGHFPMIDSPGPLYEALSRALGKEPHDR